MNFMMITHGWIGKSLVVTWLLTLPMTTAVSWGSSVGGLVIVAIQTGSALQLPVFKLVLPGVWTPRTSDISVTMEFNPASPGGRASP
jgi:hypothetical protein